MLYSVVVSLCDTMLMVAKVTGTSQGIVIQERSSLVKCTFVGARVKCELLRNIQW